MRDYMLNEQLTCAVLSNCIEHTGRAGVPENTEGSENGKRSTLLTAGGEYPIANEERPRPK